ncbi:hypothetical protein [Fluviicola taffensis]|nr:hypothetical protein [Fluviicola taffensis]
MIEKNENYESKNLSIEINPTESLCNICETQKVIAKNNHPTDSVQILELSHQENRLTENIFQNLISKTQKISNLQSWDKKIAKKQEPINHKIAVEQAPKKVDKFTWFALGSFILMILTLMWISINPFSVVFLVLGLLLITFSIISIVRIRKNPMRYKSKWLTWTLFALGTVVFGALLFLLVYYLLIVTNNVDLF